MENFKLIEDTRHNSCHSTPNSRRESLCSSSDRRLMPPIENILYQSQIDTLQWQLKQTEASREMYRAVMKQVVTFLERAHRSLEILGKKSVNQPVHRSKSEHHVATLEISPNKSATFNPYEDLWKHKKPEVAPDEIPPEKLAQEAFRLLRTAQSLLNTREPNLAHVNNEPEDDISFLSQLAKEFPADRKQPTAISLSPKLLVPEKENRFSRKLSLRSNDSPFGARRRCDTSINKKEISQDNFIVPIEKCNKEKYKYEPEKSSSPPVSSISSAEDESGFSSMNSFQEVGLPIISSTITEETLTKEALLRSMLHNENTYYSLQDYHVNERSNLSEMKYQKPKPIDDRKIWSKPATHQRSNSVPVEPIANENINMKVLWV
ncbi:uncharacterized protein [Onthophagus taurus]|uniref:uncharacterized protein isoform X2 n=1 Tax=Onthophagus taurus TaxID=166361 RepID=UPI000C202D68|nr:uncharacterized protein LOC111423045 isoform X2 [Onthophagus taurus]